MNEKDHDWQTAAAAAAAQSAALPVIPRSVSVKPLPHSKPQIQRTSPQLSDTIAEAVIVTAPPLGALTIMGIVTNAALSDAPAIWITLCAGLVLGATTMAAIVDRRGEETTDMASIAWPMLLIWPLAHVWLCASRVRLGKTNRVISGIVGSIALVASVAFAQHSIQQTRNNVQAKLNKAGAVFNDSAKSAEQAQRALDAEQAAMQSRIEKLLGPDNPP